MQAPNPRTCQTDKLQQILSSAAGTNRGAFPGLQLRFAEETLPRVWEG